jgi:sulfite reductase (NADPH) flavoprotein alpha-component
VSAPVIPDGAPFSAAQRAWLNGFLAGMFTANEGGNAAVPAAAPPAEAEEDVPWHDAALSMDQRLQMAAGKGRDLVMMAAMAQLDCGTCGYVCKTYAEAIDKGEEKDLTKCSPGGAATSKKLKQLVAEMPPAPARAVKRAEVTVKGQPVPAIGSVKHDRNNPFAARLLENRTLNGAASAKDTRHLAFDLKGSGLSYEAGDALGVWPENAPEVVDRILELLGASGAEDVVTPQGMPSSLREALLRDCVITKPSRKLVELMARHATHWSHIRELQQMLDDDGEIPEGMQVVDLLAEYDSARPPLGEIVATLGSLQPRLYSISSSPKAHPGQVHLTMGVVRYVNKSGTKCNGVASTYLADRVRPGQKVRVFVHASPRFRLPADGDVPIIMVGPGTGVAPFRAFLEERRATGAKGRNWLFFGDQHESCDFIYRDQLRRYEEEGFARLSLAFSRDQAEKVYVQHRMIEQGAEIWEWIQQGAVFYVCGDAKRMAVDVDTALRKIVSEHGRKPWPAAEEYVDELASSKRYLRDVY